MSSPNPSPFKDTSEHIRRIASHIVARKEQGKAPYTVLLGAGASIESNVPTWQALCRGVAKDLGVTIPKGADPVKHLTEEVLPRHPNSIERATAMTHQMGPMNPSIGYKHLAHLIATGYVKVVLSTNWDPLLETALSQLLPISDIKVLVRGEMSDQAIASYIQSDDPRVMVIKLHGDLSSRFLLMRDEELSHMHVDLQKAIESLVRRDIIVVGHELTDADISRALLATLGNSTVYFVNPAKPLPKSGAAIIVGHAGNLAIDGVEGYHDEFFRRLNLAVQKRFCDTQLKRKQELEASILKKEDQGSGYINYAAISMLIEQFSTIITSDKPDALFFINDPTAPGGMEVRRRLVSKLPESIDIGEILVTGDGKNRVFKRQVRDRQPKVSSTRRKAKYRSVFIVDSITFSGNTLRMAREKLKKWYPEAHVKVAVLMVSQHLLESIAENKGHSLNDIKYVRATDRYEVFFPWGVTQTTGDFDRTFGGLDGDRSVHISKRPWGTIEILAEEQMCSVRLLTLEADEKLSFQRHVCRDELFVALDDNIGMDISGENLADNFDPFSPEIKSLILEKGDYILIPRGIWHRSKASKERVRLLEVGFGPYDQNGDIERLDDNFGRTAIDGGQ